MAYNKKYLSNASATGTNGNVFVYCNVDENGTAADDVTAMKASGFFNDASTVLGKGSMIMLSDGATTETVVVTSDKGATPVTVA